VARNAFSASGLAVLKANIATLLEQRAALAASLAALPYVAKVHHSDCNFLLFQVEHAHRLYKDMAAAGVVVRYRGTETHCADCLRVTVGTASENAAFLKLMGEVHAAVAAEA